MGNIAIGFQNLVGETTAMPAAGSWQVAFPATNVRTRSYSHPARSVDATHASTKLVIDHGSAVSARAVVLDGHNISSAGQWRVGRGSTPTGSEAGTSSLVNCWRFTPKAYNGRDHQIIFVFPASLSARYDYIEIQDSSNPAGYIEVARVMICDLWVPARNVAMERKDRLLSLSAKSRSRGGELWLDEGRTIRAVEGDLPFLTLAEGDELHESLRVAGITRESLYIPDVSDPASQQRYGFIGTLDALGDIDRPLPQARSYPVRMTQV